MIWLLSTHDTGSGLHRFTKAYLGEAEEGLIVGAVEHTRHRRSCEVHLQVGGS